MILISYDGSTDAVAAIDRAAQLMPGADATVLTVWQPFIDTMARIGSAGYAMGMTSSFDVESIDAGTRLAAETDAAEGTRYARDAGLAAEAKCVQHHSGAASAIIEQGRELEADLIVVGTRGLGGLKSFMLGSVSHEVVQHADRPVLVVPSAAVAERRRSLIDQHKVVA